MRASLCIVSPMLGVEMMIKSVLSKQCWLSLVKIVKVVYVVFFSAELLLPTCREAFGTHLRLSLPSSCSYPHDMRYL